MGKRRDEHNHRRKLPTAAADPDQPPPQELPDRISTLPDDILIKILGFLPTKFAAGTSVLSTHWRSLYNSVVNIDLSDTLFLLERDLAITTDKDQIVKRGSAERFVQFVSKFIRDRNPVNISRFRLHCIVPHDQSILNSWLTFPILANVRILDLWVRTGANFDGIFTCKTLESLKLGSHFCLNIPQCVWLPNLNELELDTLELGGDVLFPTLLSGCPVLEDLRVYNVRLIDSNVVEICHPRLKNLQLSYHIRGYEYSFVLDTPDLRNLHYATHGDKKFSVRNIKALDHADINWGMYKDRIGEYADDEDILFYSDLATKFINEMRNVKSLYLSDVSLSAIFLSDVPLATFQNLTLMELGVSYTCGWNVLPVLLASSPNLEVLVFVDGFIDQESTRKECEYLLPEIIPVCLSRSLREIQIGDFHGQECEYALVEYFLKSAQVLKKLVIGPEVISKSPLGFTRWAVGGPFFGTQMPEWTVPLYCRLSTALKCTTEACHIVISWKDWTETCSISLVKT